MINVYSFFPQSGPIPASEVTIAQIPASAYQGRALAPAISIAREVHMPLSSTGPPYMVGKVVPSMLHAFDFL